VCDSRIFTAGSQRCLGGLEAAAVHSRIFVAGFQRCLGGLEAAVCDSRGLGSEGGQKVQQGGGVGVLGGLGGELPIGAEQLCPYDIGVFVLVQ
jgi:hypothetical protein